MERFATFELGDGPVAAAALHAGHEMRPELADLCRLTDAERLREEDPYTAEWTACAGTAFVVHRSRFEVDANRPRECAVYRTPADAWGLEVWSAPLPDSVVDDSLAEYDAFYEQVAGTLDALVSKHGGFVLLDLHSYNHRRGGPGAGEDDPTANPEVNLGTGTLDCRVWAPAIEAFLGRFDREGYDVRENVKFRGGNLAAWVHSRYPTGCVLAAEFKKTWMDEWSGALDASAHTRIGDTLAALVPELEAALGEVL